jgi:hypothetical protein
MWPVEAYRYPLRQIGMSLLASTLLGLKSRLYTLEVLL